MFFKNVFCFIYRDKFQNIMKKYWFYDIKLVFLSVFCFKIFVFDERKKIEWFVVKIRVK